LNVAEMLSNPINIGFYVVGMVFGYGARANGIANRFVEGILTSVEVITDEP